MEVASLENFTPGTMVMSHPHHQCARLSRGCFILLGYFQTRFSMRKGKNASEVIICEPALIEYILQQINGDGK